MAYVEYKLSLFHYLMEVYMYTISLHKVSFQLKETHDFNWLKNLGTVFAVFDQQDSGNISFGVEINEKKRFVKYAGAKTIKYEGEVAAAVLKLKEAVPIYYELKHENLITIVDDFETSNGYAVIFDWFDGECLHPHWTFSRTEKYTNPNSPFFRFKQLSVTERLAALNSIFCFHCHIEKKGFVAIDFYDGSILYDFKSDTTKICDIDLYEKRPYMNTMGRLCGSSRFMSPEEFELGAIIDGRTNVFTMGAMALYLLGTGKDCLLLNWEGNQLLYEVACKAVEQDRKKRYESVAAFYQAWQAAL